VKQFFNFFEINTLATKGLLIDNPIITNPKRNISDGFYAHFLQLITTLKTFCIISFIETTQKN